MLDDGFRKVLLSVSGVIVGFINGFLGGGGGVLVVIILLFVLKLQQKSAHATTLLVMLPLSVLSAIIYIINGRMDLWLTVLAAVGVLIGGVISAKAFNKLKTPTVELIFAVVLILSGIRLLAVA